MLEELVTVSSYTITLLTGGALLRVAEMPYRFFSSLPSLLFSFQTVLLRVTGHSWIIYRHILNSPLPIYSMEARRPDMQSANSARAGAMRQKMLRNCVTSDHETPPPCLSRANSQDILHTTAVTRLQCSPEPVEHAGTREHQDQ